MINKLAILIFKFFLYPAVYLKRLSHIPSPPIKNFLFVNTTGIGDTILSTPAWSLLRERFPTASISLLVHERRRDVVLNNPFVDNIISYRKFVYFPRLVRKLRCLNIDIAIIFHGNDPDILPLIFLGGAKEIIGYKKRTRLPYFLTTALDSLPDHFIQAQMKLAEAAAGSTERVTLDAPSKGNQGVSDNLRPAFFPTEEEREKARVFLEKNATNAKFVIGILPGAGRPYKRWPLERFAGVADHFLKRPDNAVIIFGSRKEAPLARKIESICRGRVIVTAGLLNIREAGALMERLNLFITNDSGPLHIAVALGVPTIALFCPSDPEGLLPRGENSRLKIIRKAPPCKPCITKRCRHPFCMEQISVEEVIKASKDLLVPVL